MVMACSQSRNAGIYAKEEVSQLKSSLQCTTSRTCSKGVVTEIQLKDLTIGSTITPMVLTPPIQVTSAHAHHKDTTTMPPAKTQLVDP